MQEPGLLRFIAKSSGQLAQAHKLVADPCEEVPE